METLEGALQKAPQNPLCKFERASILFSVERFDEALVELKQLKVLVPKESPVYFLMGKVSRLHAHIMFYAKFPCSSRISKAEHLKVFAMHFLFK